jgi:hypothetical protein
LPKKNIFSFISQESFDGKYIVTAKLKIDIGNIKYTATYATAININDVEIKVPESVHNRLFNVKYEVDKETIKKRFVYLGRKKTPLYTDIYNYDDEQKLIGFVRYDSKTNQEIFKLSYQFFDVTDLPKPEK